MVTNPEGMSFLQEMEISEISLIVYATFTLIISVRRNV